MNQMQLLSKNLCLFVIFFGCIALLGQNATVSGTVTDARSGDTLPLVTVSTVVSGELTGSVSDALNGFYTLSLPAGEYELRFQFSSYTDHKETVLLNAGDIMVLDVVLEQNQGLLQEIVVTGSKFEQPLGKVTVSMDVLKPQLIENSNNVTIDQSLSKVPGVQIIDGQANIRGGAGFAYGVGSRVDVLVDDLSILTGDNGVANFDFVPIENIGQVEIIKGASSVLHGSAALNGIINVRTAFPTSTPQTKAAVYYGFYSAPRGNNDTLLQQVLNPVNGDTLRTNVIAGPKKWWDDGLVNAPFETGAYVSDSRKIGQLDLVSGIYAYKKKGFRQVDAENDDGSQFVRLHANSRYRSKKHDGLAYGLNFNVQKRTSRSFFIWNGEWADSYKHWSAVEVPKNDIWRMMIDPFVHYQNSNGWKHKLLGRFHRSNNANSTNQSFFSDVYYGEYQVQKHLKDEKAVLSLGVVSQWANVVGDLYSLVEVGDTSVVPQIISSNNGMYVQVDKEFGTRLNTSFGARWERNTMTGDEAESKPVFRLGINFEAAEFTFIRASVGQGYRFPTIAERYIDTALGTGLTALVAAGNRELQSETGLSAEVGLKQGLKIGSSKGFVDVAVFYNRYYDMMEFNFGPINGTTPGFQTINTGDTEILGGEISVTGRGKIGKYDFDLLGGYTYISPRFVDFDEAKQAASTADYNVLKYRFNHNAKVDMQTYFKGFSVGFAVQYYSFMSAIDKAFESFIPNLPEYRRRVNNGHIICDLRGDINISKRHKLAIICSNILNEEYTIRPGIIEAPRFLQAKYTFDLSPKPKS
ncbi:TonB-dependent receptor [Chitinophagales bacterium]|nr:TonB-dependent receptor [Chitinophagales bacterium]